MKRASQWKNPTEDAKENIIPSAGEANVEMKHTLTIQKSGFAK